MEDILTMSRKERDYLLEMKLISEGKMSIKDASSRLMLSYRHCRRIYKRFKEEGDKGLVHRSRGRRSNRSKEESLRIQIIEIYKENYEGFGPTFASEKLRERGLVIDHDTLRKWLLNEGLWMLQRKRKGYRRWRERKKHFGELVQMDGSIHDWFDSGKKCCLMNMVDDATGITYGRLFEEETTEAAMRTLWRWIDRYGIPQRLYTDRKNVYIVEREPTIEEELEGEKPLSVFGKSCAKLGIEIIPASSPQAKGRVERKNGVYQDRLTKELKIRKIKTMEEANELLEKNFIDDLNRRFGKVAASELDYYREVPLEIKLDNVFCYEEKRKVNNDWTIRYNNRLFQITGDNKHLPPAKRVVVVQKSLDGLLKVFYRGNEVNFIEIDKKMLHETKFKKEKKRGEKK